MSRGTILTGLPKASKLQRALWIAGGVVAPLVCLSAELLTRMCRDALFDPLPTFWHVLLIMTVPAATLFGLRALERPDKYTRALGILVGCAAFISLLYAIPFLPWLPLSIAMVLASGVGLLGLAPIAAPIAVLSLAAEFRVRAGDPGGRRLPGTWTGFLGCIVLLGLIDIGPVRTIRKVHEQSVNPNDPASVEWLLSHGDRGMLMELAHGRPGMRPIAFFVRGSAQIDPEFVRGHWREFTGEAPLGWSHERRQD